MQEVLLVNEQDVPVGTMEKMEVHRLGLLHRAFSVFIFDKRGRMLLQQRSLHKYHGGGLWTNACCSHPFPNEAVQQAAERRLQEELGFSVPLEKLFTFTYRAPVENNLVEHEYDHVFAGVYEGGIEPNTDEVANWRYQDMQSIGEEIKHHPDRFTYWFKMAFPRIAQWRQRVQNLPQGG